MQTYNPENLLNYNPLEDPDFIDFEPQSSKVTEKPNNFSAVASNSRAKKPENRKESARWKQERKRLDHQRFRQRRNAALARLNKVLDKVIGVRQRSLVEAITNAADYINMTEEQRQENTDWLLSNALKQTLYSLKPIANMIFGKKSRSNKDLLVSMLRIGELVLSNTKLTEFFIKSFTRIDKNKPNVKV